MKRACNACQLCCTTLAVPELEKAAGERCRFLTPRGCGIYESRPESCRTFDCGWLQGEGDVSQRPDRVGGVLLPTKLGLALYVIPGDERWKRSRWIARLVHETLDQEQSFFVIAGEERHVFTRQGSEVEQIVRESLEEAP